MQRELGEIGHPLPQIFAQLIGEARLQLPRALAGLVVWRAEADHAFVDNVAVDPARQGLRIGRRLLEFVEVEAKRLGLPELRLYTNAKMTENLTLYPRLGWEETERRAEAGFERVFFRKRVAR